MTASEITEELVAAGEIPYFNRNYVAPRLTEMKQMGILKTCLLYTSEQQAEAPKAPAEALPAVTLDELEQVDLGTVAEGERAPFRITDDRCADWAIRKIADERSEYDRLKALADEQIAAINEKVAAARKRMENGTSYLTSCLADFFATVPHKETKTTEKYRLLSGTLTFKKGTTKTKLDETKLVPWLKVVRIGYWKSKIYRERTKREIIDGAFGRWRNAGRLDY